MSNRRRPLCLARRFALAALAALAALPACAALEGAFDTSREPRVDRQLTAPAAARDARLTIAELEDARTDGDGLLEVLVAHADPDVRRRAVRALGRLSLEDAGGEATRALAAALADERDLVRAEAAFALGLRGDPAAAPAIVEHWQDESPNVRAALVEAASRLAVRAPELRERVLYALDDETRVVRVEAVLAPHRWPALVEGQAGLGDAEVDSALVRVAQKLPTVGGQPVPVPGVEYPSQAAAEDAEVVWRALFSLARRGSERGRGVFLAHARSSEPFEARLFAVRGLARIPVDEASRAALVTALADPDWRVVVEALRGLATAPVPTSLEPVAALLEHPSSHVRSEAAQALGHFSGEADLAAERLEAPLADRSAAVRAAALVAHARLAGEATRDRIEAWLSEADPVLRAGAAAAAAELPEASAVPLLVTASRDANPRVAGVALEGLGRHATDAARARLTEALAGDDEGLRLAAVLALREQEALELAPLRDAYARAAGDGASEVRAEILQSAAALGTEPALAFVTGALESSHPHERHVAREVLREREALPERLPKPPARPRSEVPEELFERDTPPRNPTVEVATSRGLMTFELFAAEAPLHVHNFLELARSDHYKGLDFHRVVADFVVQGGCYRGDGNGGTTWRGEGGGGLRHEIAPRKTVRGSLGMPRSDDLDSGGSQFFVTHRATPHLDGRYTIFGELRSGGEVLDEIEVGDLILDVRVRD